METATRVEHPNLLGNSELSEGESRTSPEANLNSNEYPEHPQFCRDDIPVKPKKLDVIENFDECSIDRGDIPPKEVTPTVLISEDEPFKSDRSEPPPVDGETKPGRLDSENTETTSDEVISDSVANDISKPSIPDEDPPAATSDEWLDILGSGHLMKKVIQAGVPNTRPNKSDICTISYTGCLEDGTVVDKAENMKIHLNDNEVIQGIDFALALMDKEEEAELKVSSRFAFGTLGKKPDVPPKATLIYNIKLLDVEEEPPIETLDAAARFALGLKKKERGNWWYTREEHPIAINCYRRALDYFDDTDIPDPSNEEGVKKLLEERFKTYNNLCASQMKINAYDAALMSVNNVLTAQPKNVKALFRKAKILKEKGELQESIDIIRQALSSEPDSPSLQQELSSLLAAQRKANSKQRELYKKMLGTNKSQDKKNGNKKHSKNSYNALKWVSLVSFAVALIGTVAFKYKS